MPYSMTGFGNCELERGGSIIQIRIGSVNRKQLDIRLNLPEELQIFEADIRGVVKSELSRGAVNIQVLLHLASGSEAHSINKEQVELYYNELQDLYFKLGRKDAPVLEQILQLPNACIQSMASLSEEELKAFILDGISQALKKLVESRKIEGDGLAKDLEERRKNLIVTLVEIEQLAPQVAKHYEEKLTERVQQYCEALPDEKERILREVAIYTDRSDISEETTRLTHHLSEMQRILALPQPIGRQLDFLIQEITREINTIGSKASNKDIATNVVNFKTELERIREQVQNLE
ncbi:MAG: YicC family protein [Lentisphaeria bacterium]|nr:YicC family protein [Lentisphaeria bacterium]